MAKPGPKRPPIAYLVDQFSDEFGQMAPAIVAEINNGIKLGKGPRVAVEMAISKLGVGQKITDSILDKLVAAAAIGFGVDPKVVADPIGIRTTFLNNHWDGDALTLSGRIAKAEYRQIIVDELEVQMRRASSWKKTAQSLTDKNLTLGTLPGYIDRLEAGARKAFVDQPELKAGFIGDIKQARKRIDRLSQRGAPNQTVKAIYNEIVNAAESLNQKAMDKAISQAVKDKARYNAERIARTEMARAYGAAADLKMLQDTDVIAERIMLSSRHPARDICNFHAEADLYGMGPGVYPKTKKPRYPFHPHCLCVKVEVFEGEVELNEKMDPDGGAGYLKKQSPENLRALLGIDGAKAFAKHPGTWQKNLRGWDGHHPVNGVKGLKPEMFVAPKNPPNFLPSPPVPRTLEQKVAEVESRIRTQRFESAAVFDAGGRELFFKNGAATSVTFTKEEVLMMRDAVATHNHPRGWGYSEKDPRRGGNSFSPADVALAAKGQVREMRAASPLYDHSIKPGPDGWNIEYFKEKINPAFARHDNDVYYESVKAAQAKTKTEAQIESEHYHEVWTRVAKDLGLIYSRKRIEK